MPTLKEKVLNFLEHGIALFKPFITIIIIIIIIIINPTIIIKTTTTTTTTTNNNNINDTYRWVVFGFNSRLNPKSWNTYRNCLEDLQRNCASVWFRIRPKNWPELTWF